MKKISLIAVFCCLIGISGNVFGQSEIKSVEDFLSITSSGNYKQTADLDFTDLSAENAKTLFTRFSSSGFSGTYDGGGHKITGLKVTLTNLDGDAGLFGYIKEGTVKNLIIEGAEIEITNVYDFDVSWSSVYRSVGIIAGKVGGTIYDTQGNQTVYTHYKGLIDSCQILNSKLTATNRSAAGMIAGAIEGNGEITNCVANGDVTAEHIAGGIVGKIYTEHGKNEDQDVLYCSFTGNVTANPSVASDSTTTTTYGITITNNNSITQNTYRNLSKTGSATIDGTTYYYGETTRTVTTNDTMFYACAGGICGSVGNGVEYYKIGTYQKCNVKLYFTKRGNGNRATYTLMPSMTEDISCEAETDTTGSFGVQDGHYIIGEASEANFTGCYSNATVTATGNNGYAAGIINSTSSNGATVGNSYAAGTTTAENTTTVSQSNNTNHSTTNSTEDKTSSEVNGSGNNSIGDHFTEVNGEIVPSNLCAETLETVADGDITAPATWGGKYFSDKATAVTIKNKVTIPSGRTVTLNDNMNLTVDDGSIIIADGGNLIDKRSNATLQGTMQKNITAGSWNFIGLAMNEDIRAFVGKPAIVALAFDYVTGDWATDYLHYYTNDQTGDHVGKGNGILVYTNEGFTLESTGTLVNDDVIVTADVKANSGSDTQGNWIALANPYPAAMLASNIISGIQNDNQTVQGQVVYVRESNAWKTISNSTEKVDGGHGFFVNFATTGSKTVTMQKSWTQTTTAKSTPAERDFLTVSVSTDGYKVPVMFAKNEAATAEYDIFDANKMFGNGTVAEPYLICNDIDLCKEEVNALPYIATMNIKSGEAQSVEIIAENIPEGYSLTLIDNEEEIAMNQGDVYTVNIASGENADRFKLKIGEKNVSITEIETAEAPSIRNNNRNIIIEGGKNIKAEVYNTLGQKVYETTKRNFSLEGVEAGAYVVKVQSGNAVQSHKMIIR